MVEMEAEGGEGGGGEEGGREGGRERGEEREGKGRREGGGEMEIAVYSEVYVCESHTYLHKYSNAASPRNSSCSLCQILKKKTKKNGSGGLAHHGTVPSLFNNSTN